jgi:hypothetical protein
MYIHIYVYIYIYIHIYIHIYIYSRSLGGLTGDDAKRTNDLIEDLGGNIIDDENKENIYPV